jgi:hypothetical protein
MRGGFARNDIIFRTFAQEAVKFARSLVKGSGQD